VASADTLAGLSTDVFFDALEIRLDPAKAAGQTFVLNWRFTDRDEEMTLTLKHCTLTHRMGERADKPAASVTTTRTTLDALVLRKTTAPEALQSGALMIEGDLSKFAQLFGMLDPPGGMMFDILTPGEGR
jgi:alkyl sulfatase BDS1-like metallo-beta-lactamase superfamily hydrolase